MWTTVNLLRERRMFLLAPIYAGNGLIGAFLSANVSTVLPTTATPTRI